MKPKMAPKNREFLVSYDFATDFRNSFLESI